MKAIKLWEECLGLFNSKVLEKENEFVISGCISTCFQIFQGYAFINDHTSAIECGRKLLVLLRERGDKEGEAICYGNLGTLFYSVGQYAKAKEYLLKALAINKDIGHKNGEASSYGNLGTVFSICR